ncbi:MAG: hypothetical protein JNK45_36755 [Myxococcales bacterium]|nr:hypothetical protein [Myxococcales bacterium]
MIRTSTFLATLLLGLACNSGTPTDAGARAQPVALPELHAPLDALRTWFDAHRDEARFIAILSPT